MELEANKDRRPGLTRPLTFVSSSTLTLERYSEVASASFLGYQVPIAFDSLTIARRTRIEQHDLHQSLVAYDGDEPAGFAILAIRGERGWVGGFALMPSQRGKGRGREMMSALIERARDCGLRELSLEVLVENRNACRLYQYAGMHVVRDLLILERTAIPCSSEPPAKLREGAPEKLLEHFARLHRHAPAWGRGLPSLLVTDGLRGFFFGDEAAPEAYALIASRPSGTFVVDLAAAERAHAEALCDALRQFSEPLKLVLVNEPEPSLFIQPLLAGGWVEARRQHEMLMRL